jgi:hypothetical protein
VTGAKFENIYNPNAGYIIAIANYGPEYMISLPGNRGRNLPLPAVRRWSDVIFVEWQHETRRRPLGVGELKWIFRYNIANPTSRAVTVEALRRDGGRRGWPGVSFHACSENGEAIIGTPNGRGIVWLLATYKRQFGAKTIESVRVWLTGHRDNPTVNFLFTITSLSETAQHCQR